MRGLKPCPFCGGEARAAKTPGLWWAGCIDEFGKCEVGSYIALKTKEAAIAAWNKRADQGKVAK